MEAKTGLALLMAALAVGCNAPEPPGTTGGTHVDAGLCGRGVVVVDTDYASTNVSLVGVDGALLSASLVSSASTGTALSAPLTGDVVTPTAPQDGDTLLVLDRYPASVLTWVDVASGAPTAQLRVGTGFTSNPQDYVLVAPDKAYVPRYEGNTDPGRAPFDAGNDVLIVDPRGPAITGSIDLLPAMAGEDARFLPRANRAVLDNGSVYVLLEGCARDFSASAPSRLVQIDPARDAIVDTFVLAGLHGCAALALSPAGDELAVTCTGFCQQGGTPDLATSAVARVRIDAAMSEIARYPATSLGAGPMALGVAYASQHQLIVTTDGSFDPPRDDTAQLLDVESGTSAVLLRSHGTPFSLGEARCAPGCGVCFVADAETSGGVVHRIDVATLGDTAIAVDPAIGMPPRFLGRF